MARLLRHWTAEASPCAYLPERASSLEYRLMLDVSPEELERLLEYGWRRFGPAYFRPGCSGCFECVSLRIPVAEFEPSKQQRRVARKNEHLRLRVAVPAVDQRRIDLYRRWHESQGGLRGWSSDRIEAQEYFHQFAFPHPAAREFTYWDERGEEPRLVGVGIVDETPQSMSAVYTFYDPDDRKNSLGTASILRQIEEARRRGKTWLYLGYRVRGCQSSEYKARFRPHQLLRGYPGFEDVPEWQTSSPAV